MIHRHLTYRESQDVEKLPSAAIVDLLDRGDLDAWRPIAQAIRLHPRGPFAERVLDLLNAYPMYGTSPLWRAWIDRCRVRAEAEPASHGPVDLATLRRRLGLTQVDVAARAGMSQSDLSKFERRQDVRVSSLRAYARALGGRLAPVFAGRGKRLELRIGRNPAPSWVGQRRSKANRGKGGVG